MSKASPRSNSSKVAATPIITEDERMVTALKSALKSVLGDYMPNHVTPPHELTPDTPSTPAEEDDLELDDPSLDDHRTRSRKVYFLTQGALDRMDRIPARPSACRKVFRYLTKFDAGTVKAISKELILEKKTIGNALVELSKVGLIKSSDLPRI